MEQQIYQDLITALHIIQDVNSSPAHRESAESAVGMFGDVANSISYLYFILGTENAQHTPFVRHFCLNTLKGIVISRWNKLSTEEKSFVTKLVCDYMNEVIMGTSDASYVHTKFAEVYSELIKRQWPHSWATMFDDLKKSMRSSCTQFITGVRIFQYFLQDLNSEGADDRLTRDRRTQLVTAFNNIAGDLIRFVNFMIPQYTTDPMITEVLVTDCVRLYGSMIPPLRVDILKQFLEVILGALNQYSTNYAILPEILILVDNLSIVQYTNQTRDLAMKVLDTLIHMYPLMTQLFPDVDIDFSIYRSYYIAITDFCFHQRNLLMQWKPSEVHYYTQLQQLILSLVTFHKLEIADLAIDGIPSLFPDITKNDCRAVKENAENGIKQFIMGLIISMQFHNQKHPDFHKNHDDGYDFDVDEYSKSYQQYLEEIHRVIINITRIYSIPIIKAILEILQNENLGNMLLLEALLHILGSFNKGISTHSINVKGSHDLLNTGRDIVQKFLQIPVGTTFESDNFTIKFLMSFLWVLQQDQHSLMGYIDLLINMIQHSIHAYNGNGDDQMRLRITSSNHLQLIIKAQGSNLLSQLQSLLPILYQLAITVTDPSSRNHLCVAYLSLAMNVTDPKQREIQMASVFQPVIEMLQTDIVKNSCSTPETFYQAFDNDINGLTQLGNILACLDKMLEAIQATNEYLSISLSLFQVIGPQLASLLSTLSYLLVGMGGDEPQLMMWRWMTTVEVGSIVFVNVVPLQSQRSTSIFVVVCVGDEEEEEEEER